MSISGSLVEISDRTARAPKPRRIIELLVATGATVNIADREGVTPLQHARSRDYDKIAALLEKAGAK